MLEPQCLQVPDIRLSTGLQEKMLVEYDNVKVLITDQKLETIKDILPVLEQVARVNQPLMIIAEDITGVGCMDDTNFHSTCGAYNVTGQAGLRGEICDLLNLRG
jgi:chaperonin GroEL (HSP60 family)